MRTASSISIFLIFAFVLPASAESQDTSQVIAFLGISLGDSVEASEETSILGKMVISHLFRIGREQGYSIISPQNGEKLREIISQKKQGEYTPAFSDSALPAEYFVQGNLYRSSELYLNLEIIHGETGETAANVITPGNSLAAIISKMKDETARLFAIFSPASGRSAGQITHRNPTYPIITGKWKGDKGLMSVTIKMSGHAEAVIDAWNTMKLKVDIVGEKIIVRQNEPNTPKLYMGVFPYETAVQLVDKVRPMTWIFRLSEDGNRLEGIKETSYVEISDGNVTKVDNTYTRESVWIRMEEQS